jgi:hypothetical protein
MRKVFPNHPVKKGVRGGLAPSPGNQVHTVLGDNMCNVDIYTNAMRSSPINSISHDVNGHDLPHKSILSTRPFSSALKVALRFEPEGPKSSTKKKILT